MTPGQHLHAIFTAFFSGAGWADAPEWGDFDESGHALWEKNAESIAKDIRLSLAAPDLFDRLTFAVAILEEARMRPDYAEGSLGQIEIDEAIDTGYAVLAKAEGKP